jgi:hypothetical protein
MNTSTQWEVRLAGPAKRSLDRIEGPDLDRLQAALREMAKDPFSGDVKLLRGQGEYSAAAWVLGESSFFAPRTSASLSSLRSSAGRL